MMQKVLTHNFIQITLDACLKAFWRKKALRRFLTQQRISEILLVSWPQDESKRDFLDRLFEGLIKQGPAGHQVILEMARSLAEFSSFPDLENWEDSTEKISSARQAVQILKNEIEKLDQQVKDEKELQRRKEETAQRKQQVIQQQQTLEKLESTLNDLVLPGWEAKRPGMTLNLGSMSLPSSLKLNPGVHTKLMDGSSTDQ